MNPLIWLKAVTGGVASQVAPPIAAWLVDILSRGLAQTFIGALPNAVSLAFATIIAAAMTGGVIYATPNKPA